MNNNELVRRKIKVLIVEDNRMSAELLYEIIGGQYDRKISRNGADALYQYRTFSPDIIFLDLELPDMSGHEVLENIRSANPDKYVVIVSGNGTKKNVEAALENKVQGFLCKPYSRDKVIKHVENVSEEIKDNRSKNQELINNRIVDSK